MKHLVRNERGMALALVIFALIVVGALVAAGLFSGTQEQRIGENERRMQQSFGVAEAGAIEQVRAWNTASFNTLRLYPADSFIIPLTPAAGGSGSYNGVLYKMSPNIYFISMTGRDKYSALGAKGVGSQQKVGMLARILPPVFSAQGAIVTAGSAKFANMLTISGIDAHPAGWTDCGPLGPAVPGVALDSGSKLGFKTPTIIAGNPPVLASTAVNDSTFTKYGPYDWDMWAASATIVLPGGAYAPKPVVTNGVCDATVVTNWGDGLNPNAPCSSRFPVVLIQGNLTINTGVGVQGQGVLLIDGKFQAKGLFNWFGIVIARDGTKLQGDGVGDPKVLGTILSGSKIALKTKSDTLEGVSNANIGYSSCAITKAIQMSSVATIMRSRSWSQLY